MQGFEQLSDQQLDILRLAPVQIVALVGASDGEYNEMEEHWASKLVHGKTIGKATFLRPFWLSVHKDFREKVSDMLSKVPEDNSYRNKIISDSLALCNDILAKLDPMVAGHLYKGFLDLANETAVASGGFMRMGAVNSDERAYVTLPMLQPITVPPLPKDEWQIEEEEAEKQAEEEA
jgi:hypothetical protein